MINWHAYFVFSNTNIIITRKVKDKISDDKKEYNFDCVISLTTPIFKKIEVNLLPLLLKICDKQLE